jgi:serine protease Do
VAATLITATVQVDSLNLRAGPNTDFTKLGSVKRGEQVSVVGQANDCAWLQVRTAAELRGWIAGETQFVTLSAPCSVLMRQVAAAELEPPTLPPTATTPTPSPAAVTVLEPTPTLSIDDAVTETPATSTVSAAADPFPIDQGCYLFQNQLSSDLTVGLRSSRGFSETLTLSTGQELPYCLVPDQYTYQITALAPRVSISGTFTVNAGDRFLFPIQSQ